MFRRAVYALACVLALTLPVAAQEQTGTIQGTVKDSSGAVLPGVTVEAMNLNTGAVAATAVSDANGQFRFVGLRPAKYDVTGKLQGFTPAQVKAIDLRLGQILTADLALAVGGVTETVSVTAESPIIDTKQGARQTSIKDEQLELLPRGRDFTTLVTQVPGANQEPKLGGLSIDGASAGENRFIIDGIETTNLQTGVSGSNLLVDFVDELQVKSSGYTAEYGGALGGVVSAVTKSGSNSFHGSAGVSVQGDSLAGSFRPTLRTNLSNSDAAEYLTYPEDDETRWEPGFTIGGPIAKDKLWFWAGYIPALTETTRHVDATTAQNPRAASSDTTQKAKAQNISLNQTSQFGSNFRTRLAYNNTYRTLKGLLAGQNGLDPAGTNYSKEQEFPNYTFSGDASWVVSPNFVLSFKGGYRVQDQHDSNVTEEPRYTWTTTNNIGFLDVPVSLQRGTGFTSIPTNNKVTRDKFDRQNYQVDGSWFLNGGGTHQLKFGMQFDRTGNDVLSGESRPRVTLRFDQGLAPSPGLPQMRGKYGYYSVRSQEVDPVQGFITEGNIHSNTLGFFIQDAWTINNRLTINAGIRTESEKVPTYTTGADIPEFGLEFGYKDKLAPRVSVAYDFNGDGKTKLFGTWGIFYDFFKLELPRGSFGGDKWIEDYYTMETADWPNLVTAGCPPACPGTQIRSTDFRHPSFGSDAIDPDLEPMKLQEFSAGFERELRPQLAASVRYVHKQIDQAIEDTGSLDAAGNEIYVIANPGQGLTALAWTNPNVALPRPVRDYDSVEVALDKRFSNNWSLRGSYLWSRLNGNYPGLSQSDENGRTSPNVGRLFDYPAMMFDEHGQAVFGPLPTDRPHQLKAQFIYLFNFGTSVGFDEFISSGLPVTRELGILPTSNFPLQYLGRGSDGRTDTLSQTNLFVQHAFKLGGNKQVQVSFNVLNLFNQDAAIAKASTYQKVDGINFSESDFYAGKLDFDNLIDAQHVAVNPQFLQNNAFQAPLTARFGVKFMF